MVEEKEEEEREKDRRRWRIGMPIAFGFLVVSVVIRGVFKVTLNNETAIVFGIAAGLFAYIFARMVEELKRIADINEQKNS